jgi:short-subunit dehydrogenase
MKHNDDINGKWVLVTGASGGIGRAYAEELARKNKSIILVARNEAKLMQAANDLNTRYGVTTMYIVADLSTHSGINKVIDESKHLTVDLLINNAGREESGNFLDANVNEMLNSVELNCSAPLILTHHFANNMAVQGGGDVLFLSSIVAFQGVPLIANYAATKSYSLILAEGIAAELSSRGVNVSVAAPGFTQSNLSPQINFSGTPMSPLSAEFVARYTLNRLGKQLLIIPGFINKFLFYSGKYLQPRRLNSHAFGCVFKMVLKDKLAAKQIVGAA